VTLRLVLTGQGNLRNLKLRRLAKVEGLKIYEPKIVDRVDAGNIVQGTKTYEYLVVPQRGGEVWIPSFELVYFDPYEKKYETARSERVRLAVTGDASGVAASGASGTENVLAPAIRNLRNAKSIRSRTGATLYKGRWFGSALAAPIGVLLLLTLIDKV